MTKQKLVILLCCEQDNSYFFFCRVVDCVLHFFKEIKSSKWPIVIMQRTIVITMALVVIIVASSFLPSLFSVVLGYRSWNANDKM